MSPYLAVPSHSSPIAVADVPAVPAVPAVRAVEWLPDTDSLVRLKTQSPPRVRHTILNGETSILRDVGSIHRLKKEVLELHFLEHLGHRRRLRKHELQLAAGFLHERSASFWTHANPVDPAWGDTRSVCLDSHRESRCVNCVDELFIDLQQRFSASADNESLAI